MAETIEQRVARLSREQRISEARNGNSHAPAPARPADAEPSEKLKVATIADLKKAGAEVEWLWRGWLATKVVCAMAAEGGMGKTRFVADLVRRIRHGLPWPDGQPMTLPKDAKALWVVSDNHHDQLVTLAETWGIEDSIVVNAWSGEPFEGTNLEHEDDFKALDYRVQRAKPALVVIDTVGNATDRNLTKQEDARAFYMPLMVMARKRRCCVFALTHLNAAGTILGRRAKEKVRVVVSLGKPDPADERLALSVSKTFAKPPSALGVKLTDDGYEYDDKPPVAPPTEPGQPGFGQQARMGRPPKASAEAVAWLKDRLRAGPGRMSKLIDEAEAVGISKGSLCRAAEECAEKKEGGGYQWWHLKNPPLRIAPEDERTPFEDER